MSTQNWIKEIEILDANAEFWQFRFAPDETKIGNSMQCALPRKLVGLLEEYLQTYRDDSLGESDLGTLFLNKIAVR